FGGLRKDYLDSAHRWHASATGCKDLYLARGQKRQLSLQDRFQQSGWFDAAWYIRRYPDLQQLKVDGFEHWWRNGAREGRDPGPSFSVSGWCWQHNRERVPADELAR